MDEQMRAFLATIYGEAAQSSPDAWRAIASVILNRVGVREWRKLKTPLRVIAGSGFDAFTQQNGPFLKAWHYFAPERPQAMDMALEHFYNEVEPVISGRRSRNTDAQLYYSPKAQAALHEMTLRARAPKGISYAKIPRWNFDLLEQVTVPGTEQDDFAWFRYKIGKAA